MPQDGIFKSLTRSDDRFGGVFEDDEETGYFYLYDLAAAPGKKVVDAILYMLVVMSAMMI